MAWQHRPDADGEARCLSALFLSLPSRAGTSLCDTDQSKWFPKATHGHSSVRSALRQPAGSNKQTVVKAHQRGKVRPNGNTYMFCAAAMLLDHASSFVGP